VVAAVSRIGAVPHTPIVQGPTVIIEGDVLPGAVHGLEGLLPPLTRGEAVLEPAFDRFQPVTGRPPTRPRTDADPLNRKENLLRVERRISW
jgi:ribosomal protection tetracycline resistance protein